MKGEIAVRYTIRHFDLPLLTFEANMDSADTDLHIIKAYEENSSFLPHCFLRSNRLYFATGCSISSRKNSKYLCEERLYYSLWNSCG